MVRAAKNPAAGRANLHASRLLPLGAPGCTKVAFLHDTHFRRFRFLHKGNGRFIEIIVDPGGVTPGVIWASDHAGLAANAFVFINLNGPISGVVTGLRSFWPIRRWLRNGSDETLSTKQASNAQ